MNNHHLISPRQADNAIARFFANEQSARLEVVEDKAFAGGALRLGRVVLGAAPDANIAELNAAVRYGSYAWQVPEQAAVLAELKLLCGVADLKKDDAKASAADRLERLLDDMADIAVRLGLSWPRFDAHAVRDMPFKRPATVVADTSGVLQGALSFVAKHLYPMARLKIPAVLHMEVINQADRYLKLRRTKAARRDALLAEHLKSQAGQRVLLRLELREDTEVERNLLIGDPLRSAFREDRDGDLKEMNVNVPVRSYVDRMILESARQHQAYASPGHPVHLLTGDQGLARMAIAEGIRPLFFGRAKASQFFATTLTGTNFSPFTGKVVSTPVSALLWELATAFGRARLVQDSGAVIEVTAIDEELGWSAFHSQDDLLWFRADNLPDLPEANDVIVESRDPAAALGSSGRQEPVPAPALKPKGRARAKAATKARESTHRLSEDNGAGVPFYRLNVRGLVALVDLLATSPGLDDEAVMSVVDLRHPTGLAGYRRFLLSGGLIADGSKEWIATDRLMALGAAQREADLPRMAELLSATPSFAAFQELLRANASLGEPVTLAIPARVLPSYLALGEVSGLGMSIPNEGYYPTLMRPDLRTFVERALERYRELALEDDGWIASGDWLEALARKDGIHPVFARESLQEAAAADLIRRWTEGSTTDTRHDDHTLRVLATEAGRPRIETVYLYRGDFLMPDKSSSSLRLKEAAA